MKQHFSDYPPLDPKKVVSSKNGLTALWRLMSGYHGHYLLAALMLAISATARAGIYLFLGWFVDHILKEGRFGSELLLSAAGFMGLILMLSQQPTGRPDRRKQHPPPARHAF